jgi:hypothetical protein
MSEEVGTGAVSAQTVSEAFEYYYALGPNRTLEAVAEYKQLSLELLKQWAGVQAWTEKVAERNDQLEQTFEEEYRHKSREIRTELVEMCDKALKQVNKSSLGLPFTVSSIADFQKLTKAYETLVRANAIALAKPGDLAGGKGKKTTWFDLLESTAESEESSE